MKGKCYPNVEVCQTDKLEWNHLLLTGPKKKQKWQKWSQEFCRHSKALVNAGRTIRAVLSIYFPR